jgi:hypothetical protein
LVQTVTQVNPSGLEGPGTLVLVGTNSDGTPFLLPTGGAAPSACAQHDDENDNDQGCCAHHHGHHHDDDQGEDCGGDD